jgi:hypothetical protein
MSNRIDQKLTEKVPNYSITLEDIDTTIIEFLQKVIRPTFEENNTINNVPIFMASPERWKSIQQDGFMRDKKNGNIILPAIVVKQTSISKNPDIQVDSMGGLLQKIRFSVIKKTNKFTPISKNDKRFDKKYVYIYLPDYVDINYEFIIWTAKVTHMNAILEKFIFYEKRYWGDDKNKFLMSYDTMTNNIEINNGDNRIVKNTFTGTVKGYLIPKEINNQLAMSLVSNAKVVITAETEL